MTSRLFLVKVFVTLVFLVAGVLGTSFLTQGSAPDQAKLQIGSPTPVANPVAMVDDYDDLLVREKMNRLKMLRYSGSLQDIEEEGYVIVQQLGEKGGKNYGLLLQEFLKTLTSSRIVDANPKRSLDLSQHFVVRGLAMADTFDLETEWVFLTYLRYPIQKGLLDVDGIEQRRQGVILWLHALRRLETEKDEDFNPNNLPSLKVQPPPGVKGLPGMSPQDVKDPALRLAYEKKVDENTKKIEYFNAQIRLRKNEAHIIKNGVKYISIMYSQAPENIRELTALMNAYNISHAIQERITIETKKLLTAN